MIAMTGTFKNNPTYTTYTESSGQNQLTVGGGGPGSASQTTVSCATKPVAIGTYTTCTATVTGSGALPQGSVEFSDGGAQGTYSNPQPSGGLGAFGVDEYCNLNPGTTSSTCSVQYKNATAQIVALTGTFENNPNQTSYQESSGQTQLTVGSGAITSQTSVSCSVNPVKAGSATTCTATVTGSGALPQGSVDFHDGGTGGTFSNPQVSGGTGPYTDEYCNLTTGTTSSTCSVTYTNSTAQMVAITGTYSANVGLTPYSDSTGQTQLTVGP
jgi:hypothetical protein